MANRRRLRWGGLLLLIALSAGELQVAAQTEAPPVSPPYASMDPATVNYRGAGREKSRDIPGVAVHIGLLLPLQGKRAREGKLLWQAAQIAIDRENRAEPPAKGQRFVLAVEDESGPWGQASNAMVRLILQDEAVALITSTDGNIAHQAEQIANKLGIAVVTLSSDPTTTRINIPWIFRAGPSDAEQAHAIAERIYGVSKLARVLLITESGHDGRIGVEEFLKASLSLQDVAPIRLELNAEAPFTDAQERELGLTKPDAIVIWTSSSLANQLLPVIRRAEPTTTIFLCQKAADFLPRKDSEAAGRDSLIFTMEPEAGDAEFVREYRDRTGESPGIAAQQIENAVRAIADAVRRAGVNRARVRDRLAASAAGELKAGVVGFDIAGNLRAKTRFVRVELRPENEVAVAPH